MKKLFTLFFLSIISFNTIHAKITWTLSDDGTLSISGTDMPNYDDGRSPWYTQRDEIKKVIIENGVTSIGKTAFFTCKNITSITIPNSVTSIGDHAFSACESLTSITIPNSVTSIGYNALYGCKCLTSITIPNSVTNIKENSFSGCSALTSITIPNSVTSIGSSAFSGCSALTSITIPNSVTSIGDYAFSACESLSSITIGKAVSSIGVSAFSNCSSLTSITIPNSVTSIGENAFDGTKWYEKQPDGLLYVGSVLYKYKGTMPSNTKINIKEGTKIISDGAFSSCSSLISITIPESVTSIGNSAFYGCSGLTSITIPESVTSIGNSAFSDCSGLTSIIIPNSVTSLGNGRGGCFQWCSGLTSAIIGNSVTNIDRYTFASCSSLTSVTIGNSVKTITNTAFFNCPNLTSMNIGMANVEYCSVYSRLSSVTFLDGVTSIGSSAFSGCSDLASITFSNSVTSIGENAFDETEWLKKQPNGLVYAGLVLYKYKGEMLANAKIEIKEGTKGIAASAFSDCSGLSSITIPNSVTCIGNSAFKGCLGLSTITIPNSVTSIGSSAFSGCSALTSISIPESVTSIGGAAFDGAKLRNIVIKAKTPPSGGSAFSGQSYYHTALMIPEGSWDAYAYSDNWYQFINIREMAYNAVNMTNSKAYMMKSATEGSYLFYDSVNDCVGNLNETALDDTEENNTWMSVEVEDKHYVYNLGAKKFLVSGKANTGYSLSDTPVSIDIEDGKDAIVVGKSKEFYMVINDKLNVLEDLESQIMTTTGIKSTNAEANQPTVTYNVNGQIVSDNAKGLYIKNGKKYVK